MKRICFTLFFLLSSMLPSPAVAQTTTQYDRSPSVVIVTWNIQSGQSDPHVIAEQMALFDGVDVWLLQEVNKNEVAILEAGAEDGEGADFTSLLSSAGDGNHLLIIYDDDRFDADAFEFAEININGRVRPMLAAAIYDNGIAFGVANNHLYSSNAAARVEQAQMLNLFAGTLDDAPLIAGGDMNFEAKSSDPAYVAITAGGLWERVVPDNDGPTRPNGRAIDHFFALGAAQQWPISAHIVKRENDLDNEQNSDHRPVLALVGLEVAAPLIPCSTTAQECLLELPAAASAAVTGVTTSGLNVRSLPGTSGSILRTLPAGANIAIVSVSADGNWYALSDGGWVAAAYVQKGALPTTGVQARATAVARTASPASPTAAPAPPPATSGAALIIVSVDKRAEYVVIRNTGGTDVDLRGWTLLSEKGNQACALGGILNAGASLTISAMGTVAGYNCGFGNNIWNNSERDPAALIAPDGTVVDRFG